MAGTDTNVEVAAASPGQRSLWLAERYRGGGGLLSVPVLLRLRGPLDAVALQQALDATVAHYESLRTTVEMRSRSLVQVIHPVAETPVPVERPRAEIVPSGQAMAEVRGMLQEEPDIRTCPIRAGLWQTGQQEHIFALNVHHLVTDGWSNRLILSALGTAYSGLVAGQPVPLPPQDVRYADYAAVAAGAAEDAEGQRLWADALRGADFARLPGPERERPATVFRVRRQRPPARHQEVAMAPETMAGLRATARQQRTTVFVLLLGAFMHALATRTGQDELAIGSIFANRAKPELHHTVGMFATLSVLRAEVTGDPLAIASQLRRPVLAAITHQELHHGMLPLGTGAEVAHGAPSEAVFHMVAQPPGAPAAGQFSGLDVTELTWPDRLASRFELELVLAQREESVAGLFRYAADRLHEDWVAGLADRFTADVAAMAR